MVLQNAINQNNGTLLSASLRKCRLFPNQHTKSAAVDAFKILLVTIRRIIPRVRSILLSQGPHE